MKKVITGLGGTMKNALIAAVVAALVASGATYAATGHFSGTMILKHSMPQNRIKGPITMRFTTQGSVGKASKGAPHVGTAAETAVSATITYVEETTPVTEDPQTLTVTCPAGDVAMGGGYTAGVDPVDNELSGGKVVQNSVTADLTGWTITVEQGANSSGAPFTVYVSCLPA